MTGGEIRPTEGALTEKGKADEDQDYSQTMLFIGGGAIAGLLFLTILVVIVVVSLVCTVKKKKKNMSASKYPSTLTLEDKEESSKGKHI